MVSTPINRAAIAAEIVGGSAEKQLKCQLNLEVSKVLLMALLRR